jgi:hypothetical protein
MKLDAVIVNIAEFDRPRRLKSSFTSVRSSLVPDTADGAQ